MPNLSLIKKTSRRKHPRRIKGGGKTKVKKHNMSIHQNKNVLSYLSKTVSEFGKNREKAKKESFSREARALETERVRQKLLLRREEIKDELSRTRKDSTFRKKLRDEEARIKKEMVISDQRKKVLLQQASELRTRALLAAEQKGLAEEKIAALRGLDEYRRTRLPFIEGSPASRRAGVLRARAELERMKSGIISERGKALQEVAAAKSGLVLADLDKQIMRQATRPVQAQRVPSGPSKVEQLLERVHETRQVEGIRKRAEKAREADILRAEKAGVISHTQAIEHLKEEYAGKEKVAAAEAEAMLGKLGLQTAGRVEVAQAERPSKHTTVEHKGGGEYAAAMKAQAEAKVEAARLLAESRTKPEKKKSESKSEARDIFEQVKRYI